MWKALLKTQEFSHFNTNFQPQGTETKQLFNITALIPHSFQPCVENYVERRFFKTYILIFENLRQFHLINSILPPNLCTV